MTDSRLSIQRFISVLDRAVPDPRNGLPDEVFYYISRTTPLINVDLLISELDKGVLMSWRDDKHSGRGWHLPGGIIRYKEKIENRIQQVSLTELGVAGISFEGPISVNEIISESQRNRAHFISLLYKVTLPSDFKINNSELTESDAGFVAWHRRVPRDLLSWHEIYRSQIQDHLV